ncbi:MAG TPA: glycosyltransferase family 9 protein [Candidatus Deferrimicrobiaceae bacterium]
MSESARILIVKLSAMGDVVHALAAAAYLRKSAPGATIDWAVDTRFAGIVEGHPAVDGVVPLDIKAWKTRWSEEKTRREVIGAIRGLRSARYDVAFDLQGNVKSGVVTLLSGAPVRVGFPKEIVREKPNLLCTNRHVPHDPSDRHITHRLLRLVSAPFGGTFAPEEARPSLPVPETARLAAAGRLAEALPGATRFVALHAGTTWATKRMDPAFWAAVIVQLRDLSPGLGAALSWGSEAERVEAELIRSLAGGRVALLPRLGYPELAAAYAACGYMIGPDCGPLHLAAAAGASTVSVFRSTIPECVAPEGARHRAIRAPQPCFGCMIRGSKSCPRDAACRESIPPAEVAGTMKELMTW